MDNFDKIQDKVEEIWGNPRYKSLIKLTIYLIIVIFAVIVARGNIKEENKVNADKRKKMSTAQILEEYKGLSNYKATYVIDGKEYIYTKVNREIVKVDEESYFVENGKLVNTLNSELEVPTYKLNFWYLTPDFISGLMIFSDDDNTFTKSYTSGKTEIGYKISLRDFAANFAGATLEIENTSVVDNKFVEITLTIQDGRVIGADLDLSSFYNILDTSVSNYKVIISYDYE